MSPTTTARRQSTATPQPASHNRARRPRVFMMDLWATVPYYTAYLSKALIAQGVNVQVGSITYYLDPTCFSSRGLRLDPGMLDLVGRFPLPRAPRRILKLVEGLLNMLALTVRFLLAPPDIIHIQYLPMLRWRLPVDAWFLSLCRTRGSRLVLTVHDLLPHDTAQTYKQTFDDLYASVDALICHSDHVKHRLETEFNIPAKKISVIPHGPFFYDLPDDSSSQTLHDLDIPAGKVLVLWQGIIFPYKGLDLLLNAWQIVEAQSDDTFLLIAGTGAPDLLEDLHRQVLRLNLKRVRLNLRFISAEELVAAYRAADIVVYPYRAITTSGALATGLALGKTIVASNLPVFRELLQDGENARLVDPLNSTDLAGAITGLAGSPAARQKLAAAITAMNFGDQSWLSIGRQTLATYQQVLPQEQAR